MHLAHSKSKGENKLPFEPQEQRGLILGFAFSGFGGLSGRALGKDFLPVGSQGL